MKMKKFLYITITIILVFFIGFAFYYYFLNNKIEKENETIIEIPWNTSVSKVIEIFNNHGYLKPNWLFKILISKEIKEKKKFISAGIYSIPAEISNKELIEKLFSNDFVQYKKLQIIDGTDIFKFSEVYSSIFDVPKDKILNLLTDQKFINSLGISANTLEGFLCPDTYFFLDESPEQHIRKLVERQKQILKTITLNKKVEMTDYEILILASIIQAETAEEDEMPIISSVYHNRLNLGMLLQADPTAIYGKPNKQKVTRQDLLDRSVKHNTYIYAGLPPTPINSPGRKAIYAAANPANTNFLYFVLKSDTSKTHNFSTNYNDHLKFVAQYKKSLSKN